MKLEFGNLKRNYNPHINVGGECAKYTNQCAMKMSSALIKVGFGLKGYSDNMCKGADGLYYARGAQALAEYLRQKYKKPKEILPKDVKNKLKGKQGIIFYDEIKEPTGGTVDHIDLWDDIDVIGNTGNDYLIRCKKVLFFPVTWIVWACWIKRKTNAIRVKIYNRGIIGVFRNQVEAEAEKEADKAWLKPWGWECWIKKSTLAVRSTIHDSGIIAIYDTEIAAKSENTYQWGDVWKMLLE